jgi:hypothetical protein
MKGINEALAGIQKDINAIPKEQRNDSQGFNFRGIDDFYAALHPIFAAHGVVMVPTVVDMTFDRWVNNKQNNVFCARVKVQYTFTASDGSKEIAVGCGEAFDFGDKALAKAQSMAQKYILAQTLQIPTDTPDADAYTYDTATTQQAAPEDKYAGLALDQLTILRDEFMAAKQAVPQDLLGRIAVLKCEAQDEIPDVKKTRQPRANGKATKAAEEKPADPAPVNRVTPVTPAPATAQDLAPGAVEEQQDEFGDPAADDEFGDTAAQTKLAEALNFTVTPEILKHPKYAGRKLGSMSAEEISTLHEKWYLKFQADVDKTPSKTVLRDALLLVKAEWDKKAAATK